jgi:hypothetical protein
VGFCGSVDFGEGQDARELVGDIEVVRDQQKRCADFGAKLAD